MKNYLKGIIFLSILLILGALAASKLKSRLDIEKAQVSAKEARINEKEASFESFKQKLIQNNGSIEVVQKFMAAWEPFLKKGPDAPAALNAIVGLSLKNTVAVSEKSAQRSKVVGDEGSVESVVLTLKVVGRFERIFNWLGEVEEAYPHAKIRDLELSAENANATLRLGLEIPNFS